jgi:hypothetical protein
VALQHLRERDTRHAGSVAHAPVVVSPGRRKARAYRSASWPSTIFAGSGCPFGTKRIEI